MENESTFEVRRFEYGHSRKTVIACAFTIQRSKTIQGDIRAFDQTRGGLRQVVQRITNPEQYQNQMGLQYQQEKDGIFRISK